MTRDEIQQNAVNLSIKHDRLLLSWCTGAGKTLAFIKIQELMNPDTTWIVVAEVAHIKNWEDEYIKHNKQHLLAKTKIFCYASLKNNVDEKIDLLCLDEGHHATSDIRLDYLKTVQFKKLIVLTATLTTEKKEALECIYGNIHGYHITLRQAIKWGIIPEPKIFLIPMELDKYSRSCTIEQSWGKAALRVTINCNYEDRWTYLTNKTKYPNITLKMKLTPYDTNLHYDSQVAYWKNAYMRTRQEFQKTKWMLCGSERKRFLGNSKTNFVKPFLKKLESKRYICFCTSIEQAKDLGNENALHSKMPKNKPAEIIDDFNTHKIDNLFAVGMLQEGQNLDDIEAGVIIQLDNQDRPFVQKSGRALRAKEPYLLVFYYKNTRDEEYLNKILEGIEPQFISVITSAEELDI